MAPGTMRVGLLIEYAADRASSSPESRRAGPRVPSQARPGNRRESKFRFDTKRLKELGDLRETLSRVLARLPLALKSNPDVKKLAAVCDTGDITIAHLINRPLEHSAQSKDAEFSRTTVNDLWAEGLADVRRAIADVEWMEPRELGYGIRVYHLAR